MVGEHIYHSFSGIAGAVDLVARTFGKRDLATKRIVTCGAGEQADGIIHDDYEATRAATLNTEGYPLRVLSGAAVAAGAIAMSDAAGKAVDWAAGNIPLVRALTAATAADQLIEVELLPRRSFVPQANIAAPAGGATVDAEARAAIVSILAVLDAHQMTL